MTGPMKSIALATVLVLGAASGAAAQTSGMSRNAGNSAGAGNSQNSASRQNLGTSRRSGSAQNAGESQSSGSSVTTPPPPASADPQDTLWGSTRAVPAMHEMTESDIRKKLEDEGYSRITNVTPDREGGFKAKAVVHGKETTLDVDADGNPKSRR
jgi:hypothetical protein